MAAIAGIVPRVRGCRRETLIRVAIAMRDAMARRAPLEGGAAVAYDGSVALAHRGGGGPGGDCVLQPLRNESGTLWLVADGEPSNAAELRLELTGEGHRFESGSGSEVILHLYEQHGIAGIDRLAGAFAFALWDRDHHELVLGRDRFGEKPLYIADAADRFSFASEAQALATGDDVDPAALTAFLTLGYLPEPRTLFRGVRAVAPGTVVRVRGERVRVQSFWDDVSEAIAGGNDTARIRFAYLLRAAVHGAVDREERAGIVLDGTLGSAALLALGRPVLGPGLRSHALAFTGADDAAPARVTRRRSDAGTRALAAWFQSDYRDQRIGPDELAAAFDAAAASDQPSVGAAIAHLSAAVLRASGERVWLSPLAPPELFGPAAARAVTWLWRAGRHGPARLLLRAGAPVASRLRPFSSGAKVWGYSRQASAAAGAYLGARALFAPAALAHIVDADVLGAARDQLDVLDYLESEALRAIGPVVEPPPLSARAALARAVAALDLRGPLMCGVLRDQDAAAAVHELALRTPFLDHRVYEWIRATPARERGARVLRALDAAMPDRFVHPQASRPLPIEGWMRNELRSFLEPHLLDDDADSLFVRDGLRSLWREFQAGRADWRAVWAAATLRAWLAVRRRNQSRFGSIPPTALRLDAA